MFDGLFDDFPNAEDGEQLAMVEPFYIDDGELNGLSPEQIFVLGFEFGSIREKIERGQPFSQMFHSDNYDRIKAMCENRDDLNWTLHLHDDWPVLEVDNG